MNYTQQQALKLIERYTEDDEVSGDLASFAESDFDEFQEQFSTLYCVIDAMELSDDVEAIEWAKAELDDREITEQFTEEF